MSTPASVSSLLLSLKAASSQKLSTLLHSKPFPFLALPKEIRLMVYEFLVEGADQHFAIDFGQRHRHRTRFTLHERACNLNIMRTCKTIYAEAKPTLARSLRRDSENDEYKYHVSLHGYAAMTMMAVVNRIRFYDRGHPTSADASNIACFHVADKDRNAGISAPFGKLRARRHGSGASLRVDYYPMQRNNTYAEDSFQQDLALLAHISRQEDDHITVYVFCGGRLIPLTEYDERPIPREQLVFRTRWATLFCLMRISSRFQQYSHWWIDRPWSRQHALSLVLPHDFVLISLCLTTLLLVHLNSVLERDCIGMNHNLLAAGGV